MIVIMLIDSRILSLLRYRLSLAKRRNSASDWKYDVMN